MSTDRTTALIKTAERVGRGARARLVLLALTSLILSGCGALGLSESPEKMAQTATIEGADSYPLHSIDSKVVLLAMSVNVGPGMHDAEIIESCYNNNCSHIAYHFYTQAGLIYRLMPNRTIEVLDRNDRYHRKIDELKPINRGGVIEYVNRDGQTDYARRVANQYQSEMAAIQERRQQQLPLVRKVGAKICQLKGQLLYIGFVESFTDDKIHIRTVDAVVNENRNAHLTSFRPSIIWDSPLNWDLCE
ncbi:MAG: hypothetical protein KJ899_06080 [Gammaproteobacteria bacterium]|nr:hypothetical protein [Gammaproteobacteria bacterium]